MKLRDRTLAQRLNELTTQNEKLHAARQAYLLKDAARKHFEARAIQSAPGKSHAERTVNAQATEDWRDYQMDVAQLEAAFEFEKLKYDILDKAWLAEYLGAKLDGDTIKRGT